MKRTPDRNINPLDDGPPLETYSDFKKIIKGHTSKSLKPLYNKKYFTEHVGSKEIADRFFSTMGMGVNCYTELPIKLANIKKGDKVLDIGCGRGEIVFQTAKLGAISTGVDFSQDAIDIARSMQKKHAKDIVARTNFICCNAEKVDLENNAFDKIFLLDVVEHVSTQELLNIFSEIKRLLAKNGVLIIHSSPNVWNKKYGYLIKATYKLLSEGKIPEHPFIVELKKHKNYIMHINEQSVTSLKLFLLKSGFQSKVWLRNSGNPWINHKDIKGRMLCLIFQMIGAKFIFGTNLYAVALKK
jgi:ubiquinone/menaquinone biosynthesis C-methylase UbiE